MHVVASCGGLRGQVIGAALEPASAIAGKIPRSI
jgi:hypothetical protein